MRDSYAGQAIETGDDDDRGGGVVMRLLDRSAFIPGQFVAPHGACFDHDGNLFVAEWVEIGRVSKLRKVS